jgi:hypothetical protein
MLTHERIAPWPYLVSKGKGKISCDCCGECFATFYGATPEESAEKLRKHIAVCPKYLALEKKRAS